MPNSPFQILSIRASISSRGAVTFSAASATACVPLETVSLAVPNIEATPPIASASQLNTFVNPPAIA